MMQQHVTGRAMMGGEDKGAEHKKLTDPTKRESKPEVRIYLLLSRHHAPQINEDA
jgi:hypothetical protein